MNPEELTILNMIINEIRDSTPVMRPAAIKNYLTFMEAVEIRLGLKRVGNKTWANEEPSSLGLSTSGYVTEPLRYSTQPATQPSPDPSVSINPAWMEAQPRYQREINNMPPGWNDMQSNAIGTTRAANSRDASNF